MRDILSPITKWWAAGETFGLATVVRTYRSAPRDPGAAMAVSAQLPGDAGGATSGCGSPPISGSALSARGCGAVMTTSRAKAPGST